MDTPMTFGQCLSEWMRLRGLSVAELARRTGEKSATTVSRLIHDQSSARRCAAFWETLQVSFPDLTEEEYALLRRGLHTANTGVQEVRTCHALTELLFRTAPQPEPSQLSQLLLSYADADQLDVLFSQCVNPPILQAMDLLLRATDQRVHIHHFLVGPLAHGMADFVEQTRSFLCDARYTLIYHHNERFDPTWMPGNAIILRMRRGQAEQQVFIQPMPGGNCRTITIEPGTDAFSFAMHVTQEASATLKPATAAYMLNTPRNCLEYLNQRYEVEKGRSCCLLRPGPNLAMVPLELLQALYDASNLHQTSVTQYFMELRRICYLRFTNRWEKSYPIRLIFSRERMEAFMRTGLLIDHFTSLRPFTLPERRQLLSHIIEMAETRPNLTLCIAKEERFLSDFLISCYDGSGVLLSPVVDPAQRRSAGTPCTEAFITDPAFVRQFRDYFCNVLLPRHTYSKEESIAILREILAGSESA